MEGISAASLQTEEAIRRRQQLLQELHVKRLQEKLLQSIMGAEAMEEAGLGFYIDQLSLNNVSLAEKAWLKALEGESGIPLQENGVYDSLTSVLAAFNRSST